MKSCVINSNLKAVNAIFNSWSLLHQTACIYNSQMEIMLPVKVTFLSAAQVCVQREQVSKDNYVVPMSTGLT